MIFYLFLNFLYLLLHQQKTKTPKKLILTQKKINQPPKPKRINQSPKPKKKYFNPLTPKK
jgi:hypothetical protein